MTKVTVMRDGRSIEVSSLHQARMLGTPVKAIQFALTLEPTDAYLFLTQWNDASLKPSDWVDWIKFLKEHP